MKRYQFALIIAASILLCGATVLSTDAEGQWGRERRPQVRTKPAPSIERQKAPAESPLVSAKTELFWKEAPEEGAAHFRSVAPRHQEVLTARFLPDPHSDIGSVIVINDKAGKPWICIGSKEACKDIMNPPPPPPAESSLH